MIASSTEPKIPGRIGKFQNHSGRKITSAPSNEKKEDSVRNRNKFSANTSIEEIDKLLEADALVLTSIKKEISHAQKEELAKLQEAVMQVKKEYDTYLVANNLKEREYFSSLDKYNSLINVDRADVSTLESAKSVMKTLSDQTTEVLDDLAAEQRTFKMQSLMIKRLDTEISKCRVESSKALAVLDQAKHELSIAENTLQTNRQELLEQEAAFEKLQLTLKARKDQRENKMNMLNSISLEGESSVMKLQSSLAETARVRTIYTNHINGYWNYKYIIFI
jgi:chromosome segregation ATPase